MKNNPFSYLIDLFFPPLCPLCSEVLNEAQQVVCDECADTLPITEHPMCDENNVAALFTHIPKVKHAAAFCHYKKDSSIYKLIHLLKYNNMPNIGTWLGSRAAEEFIKQRPDYFSGIDLIMPIPLHRKRLMQRTYNQAELIAEGISCVTNIPIDLNHLIRTKDNQTQTALSAEDRRQNTKGIFTLLNPKELQNKHILLLDDIITTGSTIISAISVLTPIRGTTITVFSIAHASH